MGFTNAYAAYQNTGVKTASQGKLVVLLYEGAVKALKAAESCFDSSGKISASQIEKYGQHILKAQEIINELQVSLDMTKGGQIAQNLMSLYVYFNQELMTANITKDKKKLTFVLDMFKELSQAWSQAANTTSATAVSDAQRTLNITG